MEHILNCSFTWHNYCPHSCVAYIFILSLHLPTDDRSHVIERSVNRRSGEEERKQDFINLDESEYE